MVRRRSTTACGVEESSECSTEPRQTQGSLVYQNSRQSILQGGQTAFGNSGTILSRTTTSSRLLRKWQSSFWIHLHPATLLVFRSEQDFQKWKAERNGDYHGSRKNRKLLLLDVDFDTLGILAGHGHAPKGVNNTSLLANSKAASPKLVSRVGKHSLGDVESCAHKGQILLTFKLERFSNVGVDVLANFATANSEELRMVRRVIHDCIQLTTRQTKRRRKVRGEEDTQGSTVAGTEVTRETRYSRPTTKRPSLALTRQLSRGEKRPARYSIC